jgi:hypothetical protein
VQVEHGHMGVLAAGVVEMDADMRLEGALVRGEPGVAVYPEQRAACRARVGDEMRVELPQVIPKFSMNSSAGSRTTSSYRCLFFHLPRTFHITQLGDRRHIGFS